MQPDETPVSISFTNEFQAAVRALKRKYRNISHDLEPLIQRLAQGETLGDRISGVSYEVYKVRLPNSSANRGTRGGFRVVYYVRTAATILLITIYSKTDQESASNADVRRIIEGYPLDDHDILAGRTDDHTDNGVTDEER